MQGLSIRDKREFYSGLARLVRSGSALPTALELLARDTRRRVGSYLRALATRVKDGEPLGDALLMQRPRVSELESTIITAATRGGRLDRACDQLARYFEALERARTEMWKRMLYPLVVLHLLSFVIKIELLFSGTVRQFFVASLGPLVIIYLIAGAIWLWWLILKESARTNVASDRFLARIPGLGPIRQKFALARFFATLDAQLEASVNIWDAFANAAKTSDSARIISAARQAMPMLQGGERLSEALAQKKVLPPEYIRTFRVAEQAGELDRELTLLAERSETEAVAALERWSEWLPRVMYTAVLVYSGYQIVTWYQGYLQMVTKTLGP